MVDYRNRNGDLIHFQLLDDNKTCEMSGYNPSWISVHEGENSAKLKKDNPGRVKNIFAVDPSGGPFIFCGGDLLDFLCKNKQEFLEQDHKKVIKKIEFSTDLLGNKILITYESFPIKNHPANAKKKSTKEKSETSEED